jgi:EAL domain-containing protein (putative c-di-GMP-specific phosphodiesterase class I)
VDNRRSWWTASGAVLSPLSISLAYCLLSIGWILFSDRFTEFIPDRSVAQQVQSIKGVGFVLATTLLMFALISRYRRRILDAAEARAAERERGERIDRLLDGLRPSDTPEGTMRAIAEALRQLPGVEVAAYLLADRGRFTASSVDPRVPSSWQFAKAVAASIGAGGDHQAGDASLTPIVHEGEVIGMLVARGRDPLPPDQHIEGMAQIARTAAAWLGPVAAATRNRERRRDDCLRSAAGLIAVFQPIVDLDTGRPVGYESLTRFRDGVSPAARFADAMALGIGPDLEEMAIRRALSDASHLPADCWLALNVSASLLLEEGRLRRLLDGVQRPIVVELTEQEAIVDYEKIRHVVDGLGSAVSLAIDDIGEAFSGLRHLVELGPAFAKLDLALVRDIDADPARQALVGALHHYMLQTGAQLIAEGVESEAERQMLRLLGIRLAQGFLFGRPAEVGRLVSGEGDSSNLRRLSSAQARGTADRPHAAADQ